ncbi:MAG: DnaJ C-terminal domain-containing protein [Clostridia bacterium]
MIYKDYYKILELKTSRVSIDEIKSAYRAAAKKYHPDLNVGDTLAEERIKDINEAYRILSVPASKRKYDRIWNSRNNDKVYKKIKGKNLFDMFLGNIENEENKNEISPKRGEDIETEITVKLEEAFNGSEKKISLKTVEGKMKKFTVKVPEGIRNGEKIRLLGQGRLGENGGKNGDLFIKINIDNNEKFKLLGYNLYTDLLITPWEAALGTRTNLQTLEGETTIYIPQGMQSGEKIKIPNKGYKDGNGGRGDLIAEVKIMIPKKLTQEEEKLFNKLKDVSKFNPRNS